MKKKEDIDREEEAIRLRVRGLSDGKRASYYSELNKKIKDPDTFAVLNYLFLIGIHHCYLGKWFKFFIHAFALIIAIVLFFFPIPGAKILLVLVISFDLYELFLSQSIVKDFNNQVMIDLVEKYERNDYIKNTGH